MGQDQLARRVLDAPNDGATSTASRVLDQATSEDEVVLQFGPLTLLEVYTTFTYRVSNHALTPKMLRGALVDRGANGGTLGQDAGHSVPTYVKSTLLA